MLDVDKDQESVWRRKRAFRSDSELESHQMGRRVKTKHKLVSPLHRGLYETVIELASAYLCIGIFQTQSRLQR